MLLLKVSTLLFGSLLAFIFLAPAGLLVSSVGVSTVGWLAIVAGSVFEIGVILGIARVMAARSTTWF